MRRRYATSRGSAVHLTAMRIHSLRRLYDRHGIALSDVEFAQIVAAIANGTNPAVRPARAGGTLHAVEIHGRTIYAVWDTDVRYIATFLAGMPLELRYPAIAEATQ